MPSVIVHIRFWKYALQQVYQSASYEKVSIFIVKRDRYIWLISLNPLLLHPLSRTGAAIDWHSDRNGVRTLTFFFSFEAVSFETSSFEKKNEKSFRFIWKIWNKVLTFAPAFKKKASVDWNTFYKAGGNDIPLFLCSPFRKRDDGKKKKEKNFRKNLEDILKSPYLCIRFWKRRATEKEAIFEEIYINNTSSTRASLLGDKKDLGKIKRTVNTCL